MIDKDTLAGLPFSWEKALSLSIASQVAYRTESGVRRIASSLWGFDDSVFIDVNDCQGFVCWDASSVLVAFRGSESIGDWLSNLNIQKTDRRYGKVHAGFLQNYLVVENILHQVLQDAGVEHKTLHLTGHSLGGAIATIAAAELHEHVSISGLYTFGQPKPLDGDAAEFVGDILGDRFFRFVNDRDIVARVPPGFSHTGQLLWFDHNGQLQEFAPADDGAEAVNVDPAGTTEEMSEPEFHDLQETIRKIEASVANLEGDREQIFETSIEGIIPGVGDHSIADYVSRIRRQSRHETQLEGLLKQTVQRRYKSKYKWLRSQGTNVPLAEGVEADVVDPEHIQEIEREIAGIEGTVGSGTAGEKSIPVLLRVKDPDWEAPAGLKVQSRLGTVVSVSVSAEELDDLQADSRIISIDTSRDGGSMDLATSIPFVKADDIHRPPISERGDAALIGVIDTGIDILHRAFQDANQQTDILFIWNQRDPAGPSPDTVLPGVFHANYGSLYVRDALQAMIDGAVPVPADLRDPHRHGTHVASIAAGRAVGGFAGGLAPESELVLVIPAMKFDPGDPPSLGYSTSHVDALGFMRSAAAHLDKPIVVNVSLGMNAGAHDGTSSLEAAFDGFSDNGREPGLAVVKSAGNERGHAGHAMADVAEGVVAEIVWESDDSARDEDYFEFWFHNFDEIEFTLVDPNDRPTQTPVSVADPALSTMLGGNACHLELTASHPDNADNLLTVRIQRDVSRIQAGPWKMQMVGSQVRDKGIVHAWVERNAARAVEFKTGDNDEMTLSIPGTAEHVVSVAACAAEVPIRLTDSSSWGLTRDQRPKPELAAPGLAVSAALAGTNDHEATASMTGTSMAAPHVTGSVALVLSSLHKDPARTQANANQIRAALVKSTRNFNGIHHRGVGYGALDSLTFYNQF